MAGRFAPLQGGLSLTLKFDRSAELAGTICDAMVRPFKGVHMSVQSQDTSARFARNVIPFSARIRRPQLKLVCTDHIAMRQCRHCGGWMAQDESDEDCSSIRASGTRSDKTG